MTVLVNISDACPFAERAQAVYEKLSRFDGLTRAEICIGIAGDGWSVRAECQADDEPTAVKAMDIVLNLMASGKETFIRRRPEARTEINFESNEKITRGGVRFMLIDHAGTWHDWDHNQVFLSYGQ